MNIYYYPLGSLPPQLKSKPTEDERQNTGHSSNSFARGRIRPQIVVLDPSFPVPSDCFDTLNCVWGPIYRSFIQSARYSQAMVHFPPKSAISNFRYGFVHT
jgi:hypothetical protein